MELEDSEEYKWMPNISEHFIRKWKADWFNYHYRYSQIWNRIYPVYPVNTPAWDAINEWNLKAASGYEEEFYTWELEFVFPVISNPFGHPFTGFGEPEVGDLSPVPPDPPAFLGEWLSPMAHGLVVWHMYVLHLAMQAEKVHQFRGRYNRVVV